MKEHVQPGFSWILAHDVLRGEVEQVGLKLGAYGMDESRLAAALGADQQERLDVWRPLTEKAGAWSKIRRSINPTWAIKSTYSWAVCSTQR